MCVCVRDWDKSRAKKAYVLWVIAVFAFTWAQSGFISIAQLNKLVVTFHLSVLSSFSPFQSESVTLVDPLVLFCQLCSWKPTRHLFKLQDLWGNWFLVSDPCFPSSFFFFPSVALVPKGNETVPAPLGTLVSHQHLPGGWHPHVVPVERAERLHRGNLELRVLPGHVFCAAQPHRTAGWVNVFRSFSFQNRATSI